MIELTPDTVEVHFGSTTLTPTTGEVWFRQVKIWPPPPPVVVPPAGPTSGTVVTSTAIKNPGQSYPFVYPSAWTNDYNFTTPSGVIVKYTLHFDANRRLDIVNYLHAFGPVNVGDKLTCPDFPGMVLMITGVA